MDKIIDHLYLGDMYPAQDINMLSMFVNHLLEHYTYRHCFQVHYSKISRCKPINQKIKYLVISIDDLPGEDLYSYFPKAKEFIDEGRKTGNVYIHCAAGVSRSTTITISYIMSALQLGYEKARELVSSKHSMTYPNFGFVEQLKKYEETLLLKA